MYTSCLRYCCLCTLFTFVFAQWLLPVYLFISFFILHRCYRLFTALSLFILMQLLYFYLSVGNVNKFIVFVSGAYVYHFNNTFSISVTIFSVLCGYVSPASLLPTIYPPRSICQDFSSTSTRSYPTPSPLYRFYSKSFSHSQQNAV